MADIKLWGATFPDVPKVLLPTATDGTAEFYEVSGSQTVTDNGTYDVKSLSEMVVNVSGGGGDSKEDDIIDRTISGVYTNNTATSIGNYAFYRCTSLTEVNFTNATNIGGYAFNECASLTTASFPNVTTIMGSAFYNCSMLSEVSFPNVTSIGTYAFYRCISLTTASFPNITTIVGNAFNGCGSLESMYLLGSSVASLMNVNAFGNTPISSKIYLGHFGSIYVPASLVDAYKEATNWSVYADRITAYEG